MTDAPTEQPPIYSADDPYEVAWLPGYTTPDGVGRVRVGPHQPPNYSAWVDDCFEPRAAMSVGFSGALRMRPHYLGEAHERTWLLATAFNLLMEGVPPADLLREFWQIEQWRMVRVPELASCLFLDGGQWSPHNGDEGCHPWQGIRPG